MIDFRPRDFLKCYPFRVIDTVLKVKGLSVNINMRSDSQGCRMTQMTILGLRPRVLYINEDLIKSEAYKEYVDNYLIAVNFAKIIVQQLEKSEDVISVNNMLEIIILDYFDYDGFQKTTIIDLVKMEVNINNDKLESYVNEILQRKTVDKSRRLEVK